MGPVAPSGRASGCEGTQECTQIGENGLSGPFWDACVHCCDAKVTRANGGDRSVHRSAKTAPRDRFGALVYTVVTRGSCERLRGDAGVYTDRRKMASRGRFGTCASSRQANPYDQLFAKLPWMLGEEFRVTHPCVLDDQRMGKRFADIRDVPFS